MAAHTQRPYDDSAPLHGGAAPSSPTSTAAADLAERAGILADGVRVKERLSPDSRVLFGVWGTAWLFGYLSLHLSRDGVATQPQAWAFIVFHGLLAAAIVVTAVHLTRRFTGLRGESAAVGAMYGWAWIVAFAAVGIVLGSIAGAGASPEVMALISNALSCMVVGVLYMAGAAMYRDRPWFALGAWIVVITAIATVIGVQWLYLVMAFAGGGGMLAAAVVDHLRRVRAGVR